MIRTAKKLAACVLMLGVLVCGTALSAAAASLPVEEQNGVSLPWLKDVPAESIATGSYSANMLLGASQQLSPVVSPSYSTDSVVFLTDDSSVLTVSSSGVVQAVGVGTATVILSGREVLPAPVCQNVRDVTVRDPDSPDG